MLNTGSEHGRPRLSQTPYTGQEAVRKIFEQFSQISNSVSRFSLQLDSIQEAAKHISIEFHALAYQMRSARTLFSQDGHGHSRGGIYAHPSRSSGPAQTDEEYLRNYQFREFAKIQIKKDLAKQTDTKDPTLNDDEILKSYEEMLRRKAELSKKFYEAEKEEREKPGSDGMSQEQREHLEFLKKRAAWNEKFKNDNQPEREQKSKTDYEDFLKKKAEWSKAYYAKMEAARKTMGTAEYTEEQERLTKAEEKLRESLERRAKFTETFYDNQRKKKEKEDLTIDLATGRTKKENDELDKIRPYLDFLQRKRDAANAFYKKQEELREKEKNAKQKEEDDKEASRPPLPEKYQKYRADNKVHTFSKEETSFANSLNQYTNYLAAKEVEYLEHKQRLRAEKDKENKEHEEKQKGIPKSATRKFSEYVGTDATDESVVGAMADAYKKPLREYINFLTEKENAYFTHKQAMESLKDKLEEKDPRAKRRKEKRKAEDDEYEKKLAESKKTGGPEPVPPEDIDWRTEELKKLKDFYDKKLNLKRSYLEQDLNLDVLGHKDKRDFYKNRALFVRQEKENREAVKEGREEPNPTASENLDKLLSSNASKNLLQEKNLQMSKSLTEKPFIMGDIETFGTQNAPNPQNPNYANESGVAQVALALKQKNEKGELQDLVEPLNIYIDVHEDNIPSADEKFESFNKNYYGADRLSPEEAAKKIKAFYKFIEENYPDAAVISKGTFETKIADAGNDPVKEALKPIYGSKSKLNVQDLDKFIAKFIEEQKAVMGGVSPLQEELTRLAKEQPGKKDSVEREANKPGGKTVFPIEVLQDYLGIEGGAHDASTDVDIQSKMLSKLQEEYVKMLENLSGPEAQSGDKYLELAEKIGALVSSITANDKNKAIDVAAIFKDIFKSKKEEINSLDLGSPESTGENVKFSKKYGKDYKQNVQELLKEFSEAIGVNVFSLFDKVKITRDEKLGTTEDNADILGKVSTTKKGDKETQTLELAIPETVFGDNPEGKAKILALLIEEGIIHGLGNKIPGLFSAMGKDVEQDINKNLQDVTGVSNKKLESGTQSGKYLNDLEERLAALVKALTGQDVKPLFKLNAATDGTKYALNLSKALRKFLAPALIMGALANSQVSLAQQGHEPHSIQPKKSIPLAGATQVLPTPLNKKGQQQFDQSFADSTVEAKTKPAASKPAAPKNPLYETKILPQKEKPKPKKPSSAGNEEFEYRNVTLDEKAFSDADTPFPWLRLSNIDAPEVAHPSHGKPYDQPGGQAARTAALEWAKSKQQLVAKIKKDQEGNLEQDFGNRRYMGDLIGDGESLTEFLVKEGHAQVQETEKTLALKGLESQAASENKGIWKLKNRINPKVWRKMSPSKQFEHLNMETPDQDSVEEPAIKKTDTGPATGLLSFLKYLVLAITGGIAGLDLSRRKPRRMQTGGLPAGKINYPPGPKPFEAEPQENDLIEAMVDPNEMIMNKEATQENGPLLNAMNMGEKIDLPKDRYKSTGTFTNDNSETSLESKPISLIDEIDKPKFIKLILKRMGKTEEDLKDSDLSLESGDGPGTYAVQISKEDLLERQKEFSNKEEEAKKEFEEASTRYHKNAGQKWYDPETLESDWKDVERLESEYEQSQKDSSQINKIIEALEKAGLGSLMGAGNANSPEEALNKFNKDGPIFTEKHLKLVKLLNKELEKQLALEKKELEADKKSLEVENKDIQVEKTSISMGTNFNRFMEEVPVSWGEALAETLLRISGAAYTNNAETGYASDSKNPDNTQRKVLKDVFNYKFEAMDELGVEVKDSVDAASEEEAQQKIRQMGYFVTKIGKGTPIFVPEDEDTDNLDDSPPDSERPHRPVDHKVKGGFPGGPKWPDVVPTWLSPKELVVPENMVGTVIQALGMFGKSKHMSTGGFPGGSGNFSTTMRPSGGSGSSGDVFSVLTGKINDFISNTRFGAFIAGIQGAANSLHNFQNSIQGYVSNASPDTFATFTNSLKMLSGTVGLSLIPLFMRVSAIIQKWANDVMNGTGVMGRLIKILTNLADSVGSGFLLKAFLALGLLGAAITPVIAGLGLFWSGITAILRVIPLLVAAIQTAAFRSAAGGMTGAVQNGVAVGGSMAAGGLGAGAMAGGTGFINRGNATPRAQQFGSNVKGGLFSGMGMSVGLLAGLIGGVSEGIENTDLNIGGGEKATRIGAQVVGGGGGAWGGAAGGAAIGSMIFPGVGTAIGGAIGAIAGGLLGSWGASKTSDAIYGNKYRNEKSAEGSGNQNEAKQKLAMSFQSVKSQSSYSSVEEAYKKIQVSALGDDPMTYELKKINEVGLVNMLKELQKFNENKEKSEPLLK